MIEVVHPNVIEEIAKMSPQNSAEALEILRRIDGRLARVETLCEVHLGPDGTVPDLKKKVERIDTKMWFASGLAAAAGIGWDALKAFVGK